MEERKKRIIKANKAFCKATEENGIDICSWEDMPGYKSFLSNEITEDQLSEQAKHEISEIAKTFSKYTIVEKEQTLEEKEAALRKRARDATQIYKKACADSGKSNCFFRDFSSWQDFVEGRIGEDTLYEKAIEEVRQLLANSEN